jgi:hypothetical protein
MCFFFLRDQHNRDYQTLVLEIFYTCRTSQPTMFMAHRTSNAHLPSPISTSYKYVSTTATSSPPTHTHPQSIKETRKVTTHLRL